LNGDQRCPVGCKAREGLYSVLSLLSVNYVACVQDGHIMSVVEALVIIQCSVLDVRSGYSGKVVV